MTEDYNCKLCGKRFSEEDDYKNHKEQDHPDFTDMYGKEAFKCKDCGRTFPNLDSGLDHRLETNHDVAEEQEDEYSDDLGDFTDNPIQGKYDDRPVVQGEPVDIVGEIEQQVDKPIQSHDEWEKELEGLKDEFKSKESYHLDLEDTTEYIGDDKYKKKKKKEEEGGPGSGKPQGSTGKPSLLPEQMARANITPDYNPFGATPKSERLQTDPALTRMTEDAPDGSEDNLVWDGKTNHYVNKSEEQDDELTIDTDEDLYALHKGIMDKPIEGEEEGGADAPLKKVDDLSENYRFLSKDTRSKIFESMGINQRDATILSGLEWNELSRPIRVEAHEAYVKEQDVPDEEYEQEQREEAKAQDEENEVYENFYNLEKNHHSPDYKKKDLTCIRCNEAFYNTVDRDIHFNEVHAKEQEYKLPEECPYCHIEIEQPDTLDYHMQTSHGAHVPSDYTQAGVQAGMGDPDWDKLEYAGASKAGESRADDLKQEISKLENFINMASFENPLNMGEFQDNLDNLRTELSELGESYANEVEHEKCPQCNFETSWKEGDSLQETDAEREMSSHIKDKHGDNQ